MAFTVCYVAQWNNSQVVMVMFLQLKGLATYSDGSLAESNLDLKIVVEDVNDCTPVVKAQQIGSISESSLEGKSSHGGVEIRLTYCSGF